jgi:hypothetical protein
MRWTLVTLLAVSGCVVRLSTNEVAIPVLPTRGIAACVTACGLDVVNPQEPGDCEQVDDWESVYITAFARTGQNLCRAEEGWRVILVDGENGAFVVNHQPISGTTVCDDRIIFLATKPYGFKSALPHELGHLLDCTNGVPQADSHRHLGWRERGFCEAIDASGTLHLACEGGGE